jgi:hypothetical protein
LGISCSQSTDCAEQEAVCTSSSSKSSKKSSKKSSERNVSVGNGTTYPLCIWNEKEQEYETQCLDPEQISSSLKDDEAFFGCGCCISDDSPPSYCQDVDLVEATSNASFVTNDAILVSLGIDD